MMADSSSSDCQLMERMLAGDAGSFDELVRRWQPTLHRRLLQLVRDEYAAEDLLQEVFLRLWTRGKQWSGRGKLIRWLLRVATNLALNHLRSMQRRRCVSLQGPAGSGYGRSDEDYEPLLPGWMVDRASLRPDEVMLKDEQYEQYRAEFDALPDDKREVLRLAYEAEMDVQQIADELGIPHGTAKSRLYYGRKTLAERLRRLKEGEEP